MDFHGHESSEVCPACAAPLPDRDGRRVCLRCLVRVSLDGTKEEVRTLAHSDLRPGDQIGEYELLEVIGRGGMGVVFRARQIRLGRVVAVKTLKDDRLFMPQDIRRFRTEAEALAGLRHPHIVGIHELLEAEGRQFLVMEYVPGPTLTEWSRQQPLAAEIAARFVSKLAVAIQYAHQRGIVHRDLKPSNILIDELGEPRITDFGLAKRMNGAVDITLTRETMGSPQFMAPEQISPRLGKVGPPTDIHALGAILYYLLAGQPPFAGATVEETLLQVAESSAVPPCQINPSIPVDLETICLKCLEKEPARRYGSARLLAEDLERFLRNEPTLARPLGPTARLARWARRKPTLAALATVSVLALVAFALSLWVAERRVAKRERIVQRNAYVVDLHLAQQAIRANNFGEATELLEKHNPSASNRVLSAAEDVRGWEWYYLRNLCRSDELATLGPHAGAVTQLAFSPDGQRLFVLDREKSVTVWDLSARQALATYHDSATAYPANAMAVSPDSRWVAVVGDFVPVRLLEADTLRPADPPLANAPIGRGLHFSEDGSVLTVLHGEYLSRYDTRSRRQVSHQPIDGGQRFALSRDAARLVSGWGDGRVLLLDLAGQTNVALERHQGFVSEVAFSPDGTKLVTASEDKTTRLIFFDGRGETKLFRSSDPILSVAFSPDGERLVGAGADQAVHIWSVEGQELAVLRGHRRSVHSVRFSPREDLIASGDEQGFVKLWPANPPAADLDHFDIHSLKSATVSADFTAMIIELRGTTNYLVGNPGKLDLAPQRRPSGSSETERFAIRLSEDGRRLAAESTNGVVCLYDLIEGRFNLLASMPGGDSPVRGMAFTPDGRLLAVDRFNHQVEFWDASINQLAGTAEHRPQRSSAWLAFSPDGTLLAIGFPDGQVELIDAQRRVTRTSWRAHRRSITATAFSPSANWLATAAEDGLVCIWEMPTHRLLATLAASNSRAPSLAFSPDGRRLLAGTDEGHIKIWELEGFQELATLLGRSPYIFALGFAPDGRTLISCSLTEVRRWPAPTFPGAMSRSR